MDSHDLLKAANDRLRTRDNILIEEARAVADQLGTGGVAGVEGFVRESAAAGAPAIPQPQRSDAFTRETIVHRVGRPVLAIQRNEAVLHFEDPESTVWKARLEAASASLTAAAKAVGRIDVKGHALDWLGTGWLVRDDIIVTNRHVAAAFARSQGDEFTFRQSVGGPLMSAAVDFLEEIGRADRLEWAIDRILHVEDETGPDLAFMRVRPVSGRTLPSRVPLDETSTAAAGAFVATIGYPARDSRLADQALMDEIFGDVYDKKRLAPGQLTGHDGSVLRHDCSTLGGNSGSVIVSLDTGRAIGLHFGGRFLVANYAVPSAVVAERLASVESGAARGARVSSRALGETTVVVSRNERSSSFTIPIRVTVDVGAPAMSEPAPRRGVPAPRSAQPAAAPPAIAPEAKAADYAAREGYVSGFLGESPSLDVPLPDVTSGRDDVLQFELDGRTQSVLHYEHFSVVMSQARKMCRFSAANLDGSKTRKKKRGGWRTDPRVAGHQLAVDADVYGNEPLFARGHMTRREDPVWGSDDAASRGNLDSMHMTNVVPQMQPFNAGIWLALEDYALDHSREDDMRISVFTGPFLTSRDPERHGVKIPVEFWKVIAFVHDRTGQLCATGYTLSQKGFLSEDEFVFGGHETTQVSIASIESRAGLSFGRLRDVDPFDRVDEARPSSLTALEQIRFVSEP
jgi:endonuclease G